MLSRYLNSLFIHTRRRNKSNLTNYGFGLYLNWLTFIEYSITLPISKKNYFEKHTFGFTEESTYTTTNRPSSMVDIG